MNLNLAGKTVIVTGGGSNIGRGITLCFAKEKSNIVIADIDEPQANKVAKVAESLGGNPMAAKCDVTDWDSVQAMVKKTLAKFKTIDVLVNNVGWVHNMIFMEKPREEWDKEWRLNYLGFLNCTRAVLEPMIERKRGSIVSITSDSFRMGENREVVYSGFKGAVVSASKSIAREVGRYGIRANVVSPGATGIRSEEEAGQFSMQMTAERRAARAAPRTAETPESRERREAMLRVYPLRRLDEKGEREMGKAEDLANAVVFLASDAASWITGQVLSVSGGYSMA